MRRSTVECRQLIRAQQNFLMLYCSYSCLVSLVIIILNGPRNFYTRVFIFFIAIKCYMLFDSKNTCNQKFRQFSSIIATKVCNKMRLIRIFMQLLNQEHGVKFMLFDMRITLKFRDYICFKNKKILKASHKPQQILKPRQ